MGSLSDVLKKRRKELGLTLAQIADKMGVAEATVQRWESGNIKSVRHDKIAKLAEILQVSPASIMGWETDDPSRPLPPNVQPVPKFVRKPRLGTIACGSPILAVEEAEEFDEVPADIPCDFTLKCKGDSMVNARIYDGDTVYIPPARRGGKWGDRRCPYWRGSHIEKSLLQWETHHPAGL